MVRPQHAPRRLSRRFRPSTCKLVQYRRNALRRPIRGDGDSITQVNAVGWRGPRAVTQPAYGISSIGRDPALPIFTDARGWELNENKSDKIAISLRSSYLAHFEPKSSICNVQRIAARS